MQKRQTWENGSRLKNAYIGVVSIDYRYITYFKENILELQLTPCYNCPRSPLQFLEGSPSKIWEGKKIVQDSASFLTTTFDFQHIENRKSS